jgi:5'-nucleotidase (lipoprotein e(P4) family)
MRNVIKAFIVLSLLISCKENRADLSSRKENQDPLLLPVLWYQRSAEMQALYYQGYNIAKSALIEKLGNSTGKKPKAVIMDIDETVLDNSPVEAYQVLNNIPFSDSVWLKWVTIASAEPLPGAMDFIKFAESKGVEIFYVTNRKSPTEYAPTLNNLRNKGLPFADSSHLVLKTEISSKEPRRIAIAEKYDILLLIGDNLADFDVVFDNRGEDLAFEAVKNNRDQFGAKYIILPNPMYGPWINAAIKNSPGNSPGEKMTKSIFSF